MNKLYFFLFLFLNFTILSQNSKIDSLIHVAAKDKNDSVKLNIYIKICDLCDIKDNLKYGQVADLLATKLIAKSENEIEKLKFIRKNLYAYNIIRIYYQKINNIDSIRLYQERAVKLAKTTRSANLIFETNASYVGYIMMFQKDLALRLAYEKYGIK